jgi:hypothetical protein
VEFLGLLITLPVRLVSGDLQRTLVYFNLRLPIHLNIEQRLLLLLLEAGFFLVTVLCPPKIWERAPDYFRYSGMALVKVIGYDIKEVHYRRGLRAR